jgi:hypothetical protein
VPVTYRYPQLICEVGVNDRERWQHRQQQALATNYRRAPYWGCLEGFFEEIFSRSWATVAELNIRVVKGLAAMLGIATPIHVASELGSFPEDPDERLIALTKHLGATTYLAGSGGRDYMDLKKYERAGVEVLFQEYRHPRYGQLFGEFEPNMSVIDLIYNHGEASLPILRGAA